MTLNDFSLQGKVALVTGAGRGIGKAIALTLAEAGADVVAVSRTYTEIEQTSREVRDLGRRSVAIPADVTKSVDVGHMAEQALKALDRVDILVNCAGNLLFKPVVPLPGYNPPGLDQLPGFSTPTTDTEWFESLNTHLTGAFFVVRALAPQMLDRKYGRVINITSVSPMRVTRFNSAYDTAKGGLITLTRTLANEWARYNVTVNSIAPGQFYTAMSAAMHDNLKGREWMLNRIPMRRVGNLVSLES